jgi:hypothetical protein
LGSSVRKEKKQQQQQQQQQQQGLMPATTTQSVMKRLYQLFSTHALLQMRQRWPALVMATMNALAWHSQQLSRGAWVRVGNPSSMDWNAPQHQHQHQH